MEPSFNKCQLAPWRLDDQGHPIDEEQCLNSLNILHGNPEWVDSHPDEAGKYFELLEKTRIVDLQDADRAMKIHKTLQIKHPGLSPKISLKLGQTICEFPIFRLCEISEKFQRMLRSDMNATQMTIIELNCPQNIENDTVQAFLRYLANEEIQITGNNALPLMMLAQEHDLRPLLLRCAEFIGENITFDNIFEILSNAVDLNLYQIKWQCFMYIVEHCQNDQFNHPNENDELLNDVNEILKLGLECNKSKIRPTIAKGGLRNLKISSPYNLDDIQTINEIIGIESLEINSYENLTIMKNAIPKLTRLKIKGDHTKNGFCRQSEIPETWLNSLLELDCESYPPLSNVSAPRAERLKLHQCHSVTSIYCPEAKNLLCLNCKSLEIFSADKAEGINCEGCHELKTLVLPQAENINCSYCDSLTEINAPKAIWLTCEYCESLELVKVPKKCKIVGKLPVGCKIIYV